MHVLCQYHVPNRTNTHSFYHRVPISLDARTSIDASNYSKKLTMLNKVCCTR